MLEKLNFFRFPSVASLIIKKSPAAGVALDKEFMSTFKPETEEPNPELAARETEIVFAVEPSNVVPTSREIPLPVVRALEVVPEKAPPFVPIVIEPSGLFVTDKLSPALR